MYTEHDYIKTLDKEIEKYFRKNIYEKDVNDILYKISYETLFHLGNTLGVIQIRTLCLELIINNKAEFNKINKESQQKIKNTMLGLKEICDELDKIITPILKGLEDD